MVVLVIKLTSEEQCYKQFDHKQVENFLRIVVSCIAKLKQEGLSRNVGSNDLSRQKKTFTFIIISTRIFEIKDSYA